MLVGLILFCFFCLIYCHSFMFWLWFMLSLSFYVFVCGGLLLCHSLRHWHQSLSQMQQFCCSFLQQWALKAGSAEKSQDFNIFFFKFSKHPGFLLQFPSWLMLRSFSRQSFNPERKPPTSWPQECLHKAPPFPDVVQTRAIESGKQNHPVLGWYIWWALWPFV